MEAKPQLEQTMQEEQIRTALNAHWHASAVGDANAEHDIYDDDAICDYFTTTKRTGAVAASCCFRSRSSLSLRPPYRRS